MGAARTDSRLVWLLRHDKLERRQVIAECREATQGNALGTIDGTVLDIATCNGLHRLVRTTKALIVEREEAGGNRVVVVSVNLPAGLHEVRRPQPSERH